MTIEMNIMSFLFCRSHKPLPKSNMYSIWWKVMTNEHHDPMINLKRISSQSKCECSTHSPPPFFVFWTPDAVRENTSYSAVLLANRNGIVEPGFTQTYPRSWTMRCVPWDIIIGTKYQLNLWESMILESNRDQTKATYMDIFVSCHNL